MKDFTKYLIIRMRAVPAVDATAMNALEELYESCEKKGIRLIFAHVNDQPMRTMQKDGFVKKVGKENFCAHIDDALDRAKQLIEAEAAATK